MSPKTISGRVREVVPAAGWMPAAIIISRLETGAGGDAVILGFFTEPTPIGRRLAFEGLTYVSTDGMGRRVYHDPARIRDLDR